MTTTIEHLGREGYVHVVGAVGPTLLRELTDEVDHLQLSRAVERIGSVWQRCDTAVLPKTRWRPAVRRLQQLLEQLVHGSGWHPNEMTVMSYSGLNSGISPHRDATRYERVIAVLTLAGATSFEVVGDREAKDLIAGWVCRPGDLVLLRAPGLPTAGTDGDLRPMHRALAPKAGTRVTVSFRMDSSLGSCPDSGERTQCGCQPLIFWPPSQFGGEPGAGQLP